MIAFDDGTIHLADALDALVWVCVVPDDVAETNEIGAFIFARVGEHGLERFEIGVNVTENGKAHGRHVKRVTKVTKLKRAINLSTM